MLEGTMRGLTAGLFLGLCFGVVLPTFWTHYGTGLVLRWRTWRNDRKLERTSKALYQATLDTVRLHMAMDVNRLFKTWVKPIGPADPRNNKMLVVPPCDLGADELPEGWTWVPVYLVDLNRLVDTFDELEKITGGMGFDQP